MATVIQMINQQEGDLAQLRTDQRSSQQSLEQVNLTMSQQLQVHQSQFESFARNVTTMFAKQESELCDIMSQQVSLNK